VSVPAPHRVTGMLSQRTLRWSAPEVGLRRALYPLLALPADIACLVLVLIGGPATAASLQRGLLRRLLTLSLVTRSAGRLVVYLLVSLPVDAVSFALAVYLWLLPVLNLGYPLRPDVTTDSMRDAWGGPTLAGAWAVHAVGGVVVFFLVGVPILNAVAWLQGRLAKRMLGVGDEPVSSTDAKTDAEDRSSAPRSD
jgi:hypothetical protein